MAYSCLHIRVDLHTFVVSGPVCRKNLIPFNFLHTLSYTVCKKSAYSCILICIQLCTQYATLVEKLLYCFSQQFNIDFGAVHEEMSKTAPYIH